MRHVRYLSSAFQHQAASPWLAESLTAFADATRLHEWILEKIGAESTARVKSEEE